MLDFQASLIFPTHAVPDAGPLPPGSERLTVETAGGNTLHGVHIAPLRKRADPVLILGFGGNGWNAEDAASYLHEIYPDAHVIGFYYRGYRPSTGAPSAEALIDDAPVIYDAATKRVDAGKVVAVGLSIGSGVAAQLSARRKLDGVILVTPFDSLKAVAQGMYPWLPIGPFFQHDIDAAEAIERSKVSTAIIAGERDDLISGPRTDALRVRTPSLKFDRTIARAGHNDIYARSEFHAAMRDALAAIIGR